VEEQLPLAAAQITGTVIALHTSGARVQARKHSGEHPCVFSCIRVLFFVELSHDFNLRKIFSEPQA
jgi:hypothetical protein